MDPQAALLKQELVREQTARERLEREVHDLRRELSDLRSDHSTTRFDLQMLMMWIFCVAGTAFVIVMATR